MERINNFIEEFNPSITENKIVNLIRFFLIEINNISEEKFKIAQNSRFGELEYDFIIRSGESYYIIEVFLPNWYEIEEFQERLRNKLIQIRRYVQQDPQIKGFILTSFQDWYIVDLKSFQLIEYFNYRNFRNHENIMRLKQFFISGYLTYELIHDYPLIQVFTPTLLNDFFNLMIQDNIYESSNIDNKSCRVSFPIDEHQFAYVLAEVRYYTNTKLTFKYEVEGGITREVKGKKYIIPRCDKPSCRRYYIKKTKLESMTGIPGGYCCSKCYKKYFIFDPETKEKIIKFDIN